jgi:hypothetical protein
MSLALPKGFGRGHYNSRHGKEKAIISIFTEKY